MSKKNSYYLKNMWNRTPLQLAANRHFIVKVSLIFLLVTSYLIKTSYKILILFAL